MINFKSIEYLKNGNGTQQAAYGQLVLLGIMEAFADFNPVLAGTIPIDINTCKSDLDIICEFKTREHFKQCIISRYGSMNNFCISEKIFHGVLSVVAKFQAVYFHIEIFGQAIPVEKQHAYRHMLIEYRLLEEKGPEFRNEIIRLKKEGYKTEPAFAKVLGLEGDSYIELLRYEV